MNISLIWYLLWDKQNNLLHYKQQCESSYINKTIRAFFLEHWKQWGTLGSVWICCTIMSYQDPSALGGRLLRESANSFWFGIYAITTSHFSIAFQSCQSVRWVCRLSRIQGLLHLIFLLIGMFTLSACEVVVKTTPECLNACQVGKSLPWTFNGTHSTCSTRWIDATILSCYLEDLNVVLFMSCII